MDGSQGYAAQDRQDVKKMGANDATRDGGMYSEDGRPAGAKSVISASTYVAQPGEFVIKVGTIWMFSLRLLGLQFQICMKEMISLARSL